MSLCSVLTCEIVVDAATDCISMDSETICPPSHATAFVRGKRFFLVFGPQKGVQSHYYQDNSQYLEIIPKAQPGDLQKCIEILKLILYLRSKTDICAQNEWL